MTSFAIALEPAADTRLAALLLLVHAVAAASPWLAHCPPWLSVAGSALALAGLAASLACVPGRHCRLQGLVRDSAGWRARLAGADDWVPAVPTGATRAHAGLVFLEVVAQGCKCGWLLPRAALPPQAFRRLKALIRLAC